MKAFLVKDEKNIRDIVDLIHDCYFDLGKIVYEDEKQILKISIEKKDYGSREVQKKILLLKKYSLPIYEDVLEINNVEKYYIKDTEQIEHYDINNIEYFSKERIIKIKTNIPLLFEIKVSSLKLKLLTNVRLVEKKNFWSI